MDVGDKIVIYIASGISKIAGIVEIRSKYYESYEEAWEDPFPLRFKTKPLKILKKDNFVDIRNLVPKLSFIKNKKKWAIYFMHSIIKIEESDYKALEQNVIGEK